MSSCPLTCVLPTSLPTQIRITSLSRHSLCLCLPVSLSLCLSQKYHQRKSPLKQNNKMKKRKKKYPQTLKTSNNKQDVAFVVWPTTLRQAPGAWLRCPETLLEETAPPSQQASVTMSFFIRGRAFAYFLLSGLGF